MRPSMSLVRSVQRVTRRSYSSEAMPERKVAVLGAPGGIGQPLSLLMKLNPLVSHLSLYDIAGTPGVAADVSHINTRSEVKGYAGEDQLAQALEGADVVIIPAGVPRKPGMTRDDLFNINAGIVKGLTAAIAKYCPNKQSITNKNNRKQSKLSHTTGTKTFAQVRHEWQLSHPREVLDRCTFFRLIYTKKGPISKPINDEAAKEFDELEKLEQRERDAGREVTADVRNKLYVERFGPEKRNRVRGYGAGVQWRHVPGILTKKQGISSGVQSLRTQCEEQRVAAEQARIVAEHASAEVERMKKEITMKDQEMQNREKRFEEKFKELEARLNERNANPFAVL